MLQATRGRRLLHITGCSTGLDLKVRVENEGPPPASAFLHCARRWREPSPPGDGVCDHIVRTAQLSRWHAQEWTECSDLGAQSMHAVGGHDGQNVLGLNACIAWRGCQCKTWTGLSSAGPWASATCTGHAGSSFLGHVNTYHHTSPCALSWRTKCMSNIYLHVATHEFFCLWLLHRSDVCLRCSGGRLQRRGLCVFQRASACVYRPFAPAL